MNRFPVNPYIRYPQQSNYRNKFQSTSGFKGVVPSQSNANFFPPSQSLDPRFNEDNISSVSETTYMQNISQDNLAGFKSELGDMFKTLIESTQKQFGILIESVKNVNQIGITSIKEEIKLEKVNNQERIKVIAPAELNDIKNEILKIQNENNASNEELSEEINKILRSLSQMKLQKRRGKKRPVTDIVLYKPTIKKASIPCDCFHNCIGIQTRGQILKAIASGQLKCSC